MLEARPGEPLELLVTLRNPTETQDLFHVSLVGLAGAHVEEPAVVLQPGEVTDIPLHVTLPDQLAAGRYTLGVRAEAAGMAVSWLESVQLDVASMEGARLEVDPRTIRGRLRAHTRITARNHCPDHLVLRLTGSAPDGPLSIRFEPATLEVPEGGEVRSRCTIGHRFRLIGPPRSYAVEITARGPGQPLHGEITFVQRPVIPGWLWKGVLIIGALFLVLLGIRWLLQRFVVDDPPDTWTVIDGPDVEEGSGLEGRIGHTAVLVEFEPADLANRSDSPIGGALQSVAQWLTGAGSSVEGMIVWGGSDGVATFDDGAIYSLEEGHWEDNPLLRHPDIAGRYDHTAVWTGEEMIVWGGTSLDEGGFAILGDGSEYFPSTDRWTAIGPRRSQARSGHTAVWTGREMIVYGGMGRNLRLRSDAASFDPATSEWTRIKCPRLPRSQRCALAGRMKHSAVWTGTEMIIWGGTNGTRFFRNGAAYDPDTGDWRLLPRFGVGRADHAAVWTGKEMVIAGGVTSRGIAEGGGAFGVEEGAWTQLENLPPDLGARRPSCGMARISSWLSPPVRRTAWSRSGTPSRTSSPAHSVPRPTRSRSRREGRSPPSSSTMRSSSGEEFSPMGW